MRTGDDLVSAAELVPKEERYTDWWDRNGNCQVRRWLVVECVDGYCWLGGALERFGVVQHTQTAD